MLTYAVLVCVFVTIQKHVTVLFADRCVALKTLATDFLFLCAWAELAPLPLLALADLSGGGMALSSPHIFPLHQKESDSDYATVHPIVQEPAEGETNKM